MSFRFAEVYPAPLGSKVTFINTVFSDSGRDFVVVVAESSRERTFAMAENLKKIFEKTNRLLADFFTACLKNE